MESTVVKMVDTNSMVAGNPTIRATNDNKQGDKITKNQKRKKKQGQSDKKCDAVDSLATNLNALKLKTDNILQLTNGHEKAINSCILENNPDLTNLPKITIESAKTRYDFWATQPVPKFVVKDSAGSDDGNVEIKGTTPTTTKSGPILVYTDVDVNSADHPVSSTTLSDPLQLNESCKLVPFKDIRRSPFPLPKGFAWTEVALDDTNELKELYTLLSDNYVEDDDNMFRFDYSPPFLQWALKPPGHRPEWHIGIRVANSVDSDDNAIPGKLVAFISAIPARVVVPGGSSALTMVEINFLCVHKRLRSKRIAPVLISEITRRVNLQGIWYAVYTAGVVLPRPCGVARYWHRSLNPKKLVEIKFSHLTRNMTMARALKLYKLPDRPGNKGFRPMTEGDIPAARALLTTYLSSNFSMYPLFSLDEFCHWFTPRKGVIETFVVQNEGGTLTDMVSFYSLPSSVMNHPTYKSLYAAYSFYNVSTATAWVDLMRDALIVARNEGYDVFNALDLMDNATFLEPLKFGIGDGHLNYYLFNWACPVVKSDKLGLVLQ